MKNDKEKGISLVASILMAAVIWFIGLAMVGTSTGCSSAPDPKVAELEKQVGNLQTRLADCETAKTNKLKVENAAKAKAEADAKAAKAKAKAEADAKAKAAAKATPPAPKLKVEMLEEAIVGLRTAAQKVSDMEAFWIEAYRPGSTNHLIGQYKVAVDRAKEDLAVAGENYNKALEAARSAARQEILNSSAPTRELIEMGHYLFRLQYVDYKFNVCAGHNEYFVERRFAYLVYNK